MATLDTLLKLEIREYARDVLTNYCLAIDTENLELLRSVFSDEVVLSRVDDEPLRGKGEVLKFFVTVLEHKVDCRKHFLTNPVIRIVDENSVEIDAYFLALHDVKGEVSFAWGDYKISLVRDGEMFSIQKMAIGLQKPITPLSSMMKNTEN